MTHRRTIPTRAAAVALAAILATALAGCGNDGADGEAQPAATSTAANGDVYADADVTFATQMIPHHAQAVQMVEMTRGRPLDPEVEELAAGIRDAQVPEVEQMSDWLTSWGEEVPATSLDHANADSHSMHGMGDADEMPGMMSAEEMDDLASASDSEFQDMWLEMMIDHHEGAIEMARAEQEDGRFPDAVRLAKSIESSQAAEIDTMQELLG
ncbi:DUF305 domain-containing protein [Nocardioides sp. MAHUQ-72]|uniref:DUF305 domain-containing protein n=1 Tax=unclassified Nocardioides TaxID=2615069 RepID=UPI00360EB3A8